jgi:hypothetical protein
MLTYNEKPDGFQLDITEEQLKNAPKIEQGENWEQTNRARNQDVYDCWEVRYYWLLAEEEGVGRQIGGVAADHVAARRAQHARHRVRVEEERER